MRVFTTVEEAIPEVRRDLAKSPKFTSHRVQHQKQPDDTFMQEAQNYSLTITAGGIPTDPWDIVSLLQKHFPLYQSDETCNQVLNWLRAQMKERLRPDRRLKELATNPSDRYHPFLADMVEGNHFSYTYGERLAGAINYMVNTLTLDPHSRRCWWPIFHPQDAVRSAAMTRIPCSLGYFVTIRETAMGNPAVQLTYVSRSCDFERFWLTDLFFANLFKREIFEALDTTTPFSVIEGVTSHVAFSLHRFTNKSEELF